MSARFFDFDCIFQNDAYLIVGFIERALDRNKSIVSSQSCHPVVKFMVSMGPQTAVIAFSRVQRLNVFMPSTNTWSSMGL